MTSNRLEHELNRLGPNACQLAFGGGSGIYSEDDDPLECVPFPVKSSRQDQPGADQDHPQLILWGAPAEEKERDLTRTSPHLVPFFCSFL